MFLSHISFALGLIALVAGVSLFLWSVRAEMGAGITLAKITGIIVIVLAVIQVLSTVYTTVRHREFIRFMMMRSQQNQGMMQSPQMPSNNTNAPVSGQ